MDVEQIKELLSNIYARYIMRDFLGKVLPGAIIFITFYISFLKKYIAIEEVFKHDIPVILYWITAFLLIGLFHVIGLSAQLAGEFLALHSPHPKPYKLFSLIALPKGKIARESYNERQQKLENYTLTRDQKKQVERFVYLKEESGNCAIAFLISGIMLFHFTEIGIALLIIGLICYYSHVVHRSRQVYKEIQVLNIEPDKTAIGEPL
jgi:hypothetical protein